MCGIAGILLEPGKRVDPDALTRMTDRLAHRGPDGAGTWISTDGRVGFGHRRLSIIDLTAAGAQPMTSAGDRYVITYNGELYNFVDLRLELEGEGFRFRGHSDTEIMLAAFDRWGVERAIERFLGMFAFAVWDKSDGRLYLARDRLGIKPVYYGMFPGSFAFASDLRAFQPLPGARLAVSRAALGEFLRYGYVPAPLSIFENIHKLPAGSLLIAAPDGGHRIRQYWSAAAVASAGLDHPYPGNDAETVDALEALLRDSVKRHMVADVPIGALLSGGVDSSTVTALMQTLAGRRVKTFTIGFTEQQYNEAIYAKAVARHLDTDHVELYVTDREAREVIPGLPDIYDEPFADASQIPTYLVSRLAREQVTVVLSGDGGDELFGGYNRYLFVSRFWSRLRMLPGPLRRLLAGLIDTIGPRAWERIFSLTASLAPRIRPPVLPGQKMQKVASLLRANDVGDVYHRLITQWPFPEHIVRPEGMSMPGAPPRDLQGFDSVARQMCWDMRGYLVDDILNKLDRASMHVGLEARVPLLDHRVVEFAWRIPLSRKFRSGNGKWVLKQVLARHVPAALFERSKMGFGVPVDDWLRGPLREWAETCLAPERLRDEGFLDPGIVHQTWREHLAGRVDRGGPIWVVLMFETWLERFKSWA